VSSLLQDGYVYRKIGRRDLILGISGGRVVGQFKMTAEARGKLKPGLYNVDGSYLGPESEYLVDEDGDAVNPTEENE
jgi:hypothetical protein